MKEYLQFLKKNKKMLAVLLALILLLSILSLSASNETDESNVGLSEYGAMLEDELEELCASIDGVGRCKVYLSFESGEENLYKGGVLIETRPPRVLGVSVVCEGGGKSFVQSELIDLFTSLFGIGANRVKISKLK